MSDTVKWEYAPVEFQAEASKRAESLNEILLSKGAEGWELVYVGDPEPFTAARINYDRRLLIFKRQKSETLTG
jgi:hypothetical protein